MVETPFSIQVTNPLPPEIDGFGERVRDYVAEQGGLGARVLWTAAGTDALNAIRRHLSIDLAGELAKAWATAVELRDYRNEERHPRDRDEEFALGEVAVDLEAEPLLTIRLGPLEPPPMRFGYTITAEFEAVTLTIRNGAVWAAAPGPGRLTGVLTFRGEALHPPVRLVEGRLPERLTFDPVPIP